MIQRLETVEIYKGSVCLGDLVVAPGGGYRTVTPPVLKELRKHGTLFGSTYRETGGMVKKVIRVIRDDK